MSGKISTLFLIVLSLAAAIAVSAQQLALSGIVRDSNGAVISNATVSALNTATKTESKATTGSDGSFTFSALPAGTYQLTVTATGFERKVIENIRFDGAVVLTQDVSLAVGKIIDTVTVRPEETNKFATTESDTAAKMPLKDIENPQVINSVSNQLIKEQITTSFDQALNNATGISRLWESTGRAGDGGGYYGSRGFFEQSTMKNGFASYSNGTPDVQSIETIEVIKGPSGTLYGGALTSHGGLININTKKPSTERPFVDLSYTYGSFNSNRVTVDWNQAINSKYAFRVNSAYTNNGSFRDYGFQRSFFISPTLYGSVNDRLSFNIDMSYIYDNRIAPTMLFIAREYPLRSDADTLGKIGVDADRSYTSNDLNTKNPAWNLQGQVNYRFNSSWHSQTEFSGYTTWAKGYYSYLYDSTTFIEDALEIPQTGLIFDREATHQNGWTNGFNIQENITGDLRIGKLRNRLLVGADYYWEHAKDKDSAYLNQGFVFVGRDNSTFLAELPFLHAYYGSEMCLNAIGDDSGCLTSAGLPFVEGSPYDDKLKNTSFYVNDVLNIRDDLLVSGGVRYNYYDLTDTNSWYGAPETTRGSQHRWSEKFGVIYMPLKEKVSLFFNFQDGFQRPWTLTDYVDSVPHSYYGQPEHSTQYEGGVKLNAFDGRLAGTVSYFYIKVKDMALYHGDYTNGHYELDGKQRNKGFEATLDANPLDGWNLTFGYSHVDSVVHNDPEYDGLSSESAGPGNMANFWTSYRFTKHSLSGLGFGFGGNYGDRFATLNRHTTGRFYLPAYFVLNATAFYDRRRYRVGVKFDNMTNERFNGGGWSTINPQPPRSVSASLTVKF